MKGLGRNTRFKTKSKKGYNFGGRTVNPRAAGAAAMRINKPKPRIRQGNPSKPFIPRTHGGSNDQSDPRDWAAGGDTKVQSYKSYVKKMFGGGKT